jgi:isoleucyl-tRNA synthetase
LFSEIKRIHQEKTSLDHSPNVIWKNNDEENITQLESRVLATYDAILERYRGKKILIVSHGGVFRPINRRTFGLSIDEAYYQVPSLANASMTKVPPYSLANPLDRWIFSRSQALVRDVTRAFESYDLQLVTRLIVEAMDDLSNWYLRRSRRRFWKSEDRTDKDMAYQTLFDTLLTFAHILAPVTPFITEAVYRILTDKQSIHLNMYPRFESRFIFEEQNRDMALCQKMVSLGLAARAAKKIRVRQPLASITISEPLSSYYHDIIRDELNVKEVRFEEAQKFARAVCKPNARLLGPKFGKSVQEIIRLAKEGKFLTLDDGKIQVGEAVLLPEEYELAYEPLMTDNHHDVLGGFGTVIALDTEISESLKLEGLARDIIRVIQDARKKAGYQVSDRVDVCISGEGIEAILSQYRSFIENETFSIVVPALDGADITVSETIDERGFTFSVKKK